MVVVPRTASHRSAGAVLEVALALDD